MLRSKTNWIFLFDYYVVLLVAASAPRTGKYSQVPEDDLLFPPNAVQRYAHTKPGSYFGYSVASYVGQSQSFCLVGAPRASQDRPGDLLADFGSSSSDPSSATGLVYRIDLDFKLPYCSVVPIATTDEARREHGTPTPGISSWLGGTVAAASNAQNGIQLGCDPRYIYAPEPINQTASDGIRPTDSRPLHSQNLLGTGQCALYTGASMQYTSVDACIGQEEGACLAGFSADVETGTAFGEAHVVLGMPGSYLTEGNVFLGHYRGRELVNAMRLKSSPQDLKHKGFNLGYAVLLDELVRKSVSHPTSAQHQNGLDVEPVGQDRRARMSLLVSSSMWLDNDYRGIVMILDQAMDLGGITYLNDQWGHIGSFFGYSLATADLDGNGIADIIVGSPYFTERKDDKDQDDSDWSVKSAKSNRPRDTLNAPREEEVDSDPNIVDRLWGRLLPDIGRVYVFHGFPSNLTSNTLVNSDSLRPDYLSRPPVIVDGPKSVGGRFGHSVVSMGDVDGDGTEDLAISCPYCSDPEGTREKGAVFIYLGKKDSILEDEPFQVIWPAELPRAAPITTCGDFDTHDSGHRIFKSFGWSLSAGIDLDGNHAPDLIVGDFDSDQVVFLRARNTIWFDSPEWDLPLARTLPWSGPDETECGTQCQFRVQLSVRVHGKPSLLQRHQTAQFKLHVAVDMDASIVNLVYKRLAGISNVENAGGSGFMSMGMLESVVPVTITRDTLTDTNRMVLLSLTLEPQSARVRPYIWKPILLNATITPASNAMSHVPGPKEVNSWMLHPFLGERHFVSRPLQFANPACGADNICYADLQVRMMDMSVGALEKLVVYFRERVTQRNLTVGVGNLGENAYAAQLRITIPHQFSFVIPEELHCQSTVFPDIQATQILCELGDPLGYTGRNLRPFVFQLNTAGAFRELDEPVNDQPATSSNASESNLEPSLKPQWSSSNDRLRRSKRATVSKDSVTITAEVICGNEDQDLRDNKATITYKLQLAAKIELSSSSLDRTTIDTRNFTVQLYEMQRVHPETLGPEIKHIYLVSNDGPSPIENLWVNVSLPIQTSEGEHLVYILDRVRYHAEDGGPPLIAATAPEVISAEGDVRGMCTTPDWALNPLRLNAVHRGRGQQIFNAQPEDEDNLIRRVRSIEDDNYKPPHPKQSELENSSSVRATRSIISGVRKRQQEIIKCEQETVNLGTPLCATIRCRIDQLSRGDAVRIVIRGHVWADTFFRHKISDLAIVSEARSEMASVAFGISVHGNRTIEPLAISQNFVFQGIKVPLFRQIPLWPIILGCILGAALLAFIILGMWRCGFFRRRRWYDNAAGNSMSVVPTDL
ncbi:hypothetical protein CRM22_004334 [Opisthorchis felineus]|uniref:Uncharacterized protein n=1 Tax=Opisthorchis felineus TaxID=147828 RepID=A0A4S2LXG9_OPIFE|nr:hypothetical protein CRM22_004334 [Opisthorchis felineus]